MARITPAGDGFYARGKRERAERLRELEQDYRHALLDTDERERLRDEILRLRRELERSKA